MHMWVKMRFKFWLIEQFFDDISWFLYQKQTFICSKWWKWNDLMKNFQIYQIYSALPNCKNKFDSNFKSAWSLNCLTQFICRLYLLVENFVLIWKLSLTTWEHIKFKTMHVKYMIVLICRVFHKLELGIANLDLKFLSPTGLSLEIIWGKKIKLNLLQFSFFFQKNVFY